MHMANLIRSAKSGNDWTRNDLEKYHIIIRQVAPLPSLFYGLQEFPEPMVDQELLTVLGAASIQQDYNTELIVLLDLATRDETAVDDFVVQLFQVLGYFHRQRVARVDLPFFICGEWKHATTDVCLVDRSRTDDILLLVQAGKRLEQADAQVQLVAEAVAAFNKNNERREILGFVPLASKVMPGIVMVGTSPAFFKIPVTQTLSDHTIAHGTYPPEETQVTYCVPSFPRPDHRHGEGMKPLNNRREILKCFEAFKAVVGI